MAEQIQEAVVAEGVIRARAAYLRDFKALYADKKTRGMFVCYHNDQLVLVNQDYRAIVNESYARDIPENASVIAKVTPDSEQMHRAIYEEAEL